MKRQITFTIDDGLLKSIDDIRGEVPRSRMIGRAVEKMYGKTEQPQKKDGDA